jgi:hypothetical protein
MESSVPSACGPYVCVCACVCVCVCMCVCVCVRARDAAKRPSYASIRLICSALPPRCCLRLQQPSHVNASPASSPDDDNDALDGAPRQPKACAASFPGNRTAAVNLVTPERPNGDTVGQRQRRKPRRARRQLVSAGVGSKQLLLCGCFARDFKSHGR